MKAKLVTTTITAVLILFSSMSAFAAGADSTAPTTTPNVDKTAPTTAKTTSSNKPLGKITCQDFVDIEDVIKPQFVIASVAHTKGGKPKNVVIEIVDTDTLVPFLVEECQKAPKESFWEKLKKKL
jgi:HdeA/HdeB family